MLSMFSFFFVEVVNTVFAGHIGDESMIAGVGIANMYINVVFLSWSIGMNNTISTLVS